MVLRDQLLSQCDAFQKKKGKLLMKKNTKSIVESTNQSSNFNEESKSCKSLVKARKITIVFCDLHKLLIYIRKSSHSGKDVLIRTKSNGISVKFFITIRKGMV